MRRMIGGSLAGVLVGLLGLLTLGLGGVTDAGADCGGPTIRVSPDGGPAGSTVTVSGEAFGDNCYDTGPPPPGQGVLGHPQAGVVISFTDSAFTRTVLATVDARADYTFSVTVVVPAGVATGTASIQAEGSTPFVAPAPFEVTGGVIPATPAYTG